jgi:hypothetical protein
MGHTCAVDTPGRARYGGKTSFRVSHFHRSTLKPLVRFAFTPFDSWANSAILPSAMSSPEPSLPRGWSTVEVTPLEREWAEAPESGSQPDPVQRPQSGSVADGEPLRAQLRAQHREILRRIFLGEPMNDVASAVGIPYATVKYIVRSPLFQAAMAEMQREADSKVLDTAQRMRMERELTNAAESGIPIAFKAMNESQSPATRAKIAFGFLDRAGMSPSRKVEEKREGFREMLERLDEMERHMAPGSEVTAEVKFSVRKEGEYDTRAGVSPVIDAPSNGDRDKAGGATESADAGSARADRAAVDPVAFLTRSLSG